LNEDVRHPPPERAEAGATSTGLAALQVTRGNRSGPGRRGCWSSEVGRDATPARNMCRPNEPGPPWFARTGPGRSGP